jgi:hypothetical protein
MTLSREKHYLFYLKMPDENKKIILNIPNVGYIEHLNNIKQAEKLELQAVSLSFELKTSFLN